MTDYTALYRQALAEGSRDRVHVVLTSAQQAARVGAISKEEIAELAAEVKANPPQ